MRSTSSPLAGRILWGLLIGVVAGVATLGIGWVWPDFLAGAKIVSTQVFDPLGQVFLRMLFFVVVPLVFSSLATGVAQLGRLDRLGPLAGSTFTLFFANMVIAVGIGLVVMNLLQPGVRLGAQERERLLADYGGVAQKLIAARQDSPQVTPATLVEMFMPRNLLGAVVGQSHTTLGDVLPLILFAILVGAAALKLPEQRRAGLIAGLELVTELMTAIVHFALRLAPYAVPAMVYSVIVKIGLGILATLGLFVAGCVAGLMLHLFGTLSLWLRFLAGRSPIAFFRDSRAVLVTAFSTSSSNATLPTALDCAKNNLGLRPSVSGFVLPLGATMNMSGTALFEGCVVLFVAQVFAVPLGLGQQMTLLVLSVLSAVAVAGIPGGSLPLIAGLLTSFGVPAEGLGIVIGVDRLLDMTRTVVNVEADLVTAAVVDARMTRSEEKRCARQPGGRTLQDGREANRRFP